MKNKKSKLSKFSWIKLVPIAFIISIVPLIVFLKEIPLEGILTEYWKSDKNMDFFSYYKMIWFLIATSVSLITYLIVIYFKDELKLRKNYFKKTYYYIPLAIYGLFVLLSSLLSEHLKVALIGFPDRYEGMFVLLGYVVVTFVTINLVNSKKDIKFL